MDGGLLGAHQEQRQYASSPGRWWVLLCYCLMGILQACQWNVYGPIFPLVLRAFPSWTTTFLNWVINSANITFVLAIGIVAHAAACFGHRKPTLVSAFCLLVSAGLRCLPVPDSQLQKWLTVSSMLLNGIGGAWFSFAGPVLSELWFPLPERTFATAASVSSVALGQAVGFVVGPAVVGGGQTGDTAATARSQLDRLFYVEAAATGVVTLMCLVYYPDRPRHPPSEAAAAKRAASIVCTEDEEAVHSDPQAATSSTATLSTAMPSTAACPARLTGERTQQQGVGVFCALGGRKSRGVPRGAPRRQYWLLALASSIPMGVFQGWGSVLFECLKPFEFSEDEAAYLGFWMTTAGCAGALLVGATLDRVEGRLKLASAVLMLVATACYGVFSAIAAGLLPQLSRETSIRLAYATGIGGGAAFNSATPPLFELLMETVYGWADEGVGSMLSVLAGTLVQVGFLVQMAATNAGASKLWTCWVNAAAMGVGTLALLATRVEYRRLAIDRGVPLAEAGCRFDRSWGCL